MGTTTDDEVLRYGQLQVRPAEMAARVDGRVLSLTVREVAVLIALARREGRIVSREELYPVVWGEPMKKRDRSVDVYVRKLRTKLECAVPGTRYIHTHHGLGYRFAPEIAESPH